MRVILLEEIEGLGAKGDLVDVSDGFARNRLLPLGSVVEDTPGNASLAEKLRRAAVSEEAQRVEAAAAVADGLESLDLVFEERAQEDGSLYGAVTAARIAQELQARGLDVDERHIKLPEPVKSTGTRSVRIELHPEVSVDLAILVAAVDVPEADEEGDVGPAEEPAAEQPSAEDAEAQTAL